METCYFFSPEDIVYLEIWENYSRDEVKYDNNGRHPSGVLESSILLLYPANNNSVVSTLLNSEGAIGNE